VFKQSRGEVESERGKQEEERNGCNVSKTTCIRPHTHRQKEREWAREREREREIERGGRRYAWNTATMSVDALFSLSHTYTHTKHIHTL